MVAGMELVEAARATAAGVLRSLQVEPGGLSPEEHERRLAI